MVIALLSVFAIAAMALPAQAQAAAKAKVWVITNATTKSGYDFTIKEGYKYDANGLLVKIKAVWPYETVTEAYKYDKTGNYTKWNHLSGIIPLTFDKKKRVTGIEYQGYTEKFTYNAQGRCATMGGMWKVAYDKKGLVKSYAGYKASKGYSRKYVRDNKGNIVKCKDTTQGLSSTTKYTYAGGRVNTWKTTDSGIVHSGSLKYKQISVPKAYVAKVKAQQRWILDNVPFGRGGSDCWGVPLVCVNK
jgi:hypothetical protein